MGSMGITQLVRTEAWTKHATRKQSAEASLTSFLLTAACTNLCRDEITATLKDKVGPLPLDMQEIAY